MKNLWRNFLSVVAFCIIPFLWVALNVARLPQSTFKDLYVDWKEWHDSGKSWGAFDSDIK